MEPIRRRESLHGEPRVYSWLIFFLFSLELDEEGKSEMSIEREISGTIWAIEFFPLNVCKREG
jgi:hypothetical protein